MKTLFYRHQARSFAFSKADYQTNMSKLLHSKDVLKGNLSSHCPVQNKKINYHIYGLPIQPLNSDNINDSGFLTDGEKS